MFYCIAIAYWFDSYNVTCTFLQVRVIDCFLYEGSKVLLRIALAIFHLFVKTLTHDSSMVASLPSRGLHETLYQFCQNIQVSYSLQR